MSDLLNRLASLTSSQRSELKARYQIVEKRNEVLPIAVIGMGCRFPGGANSPELFWQSLCEGFDGVRTVPPERLKSDVSGSRQLSSSNPTRGGFLDQVDHFDREFFGLSPREVVHMDPQQRLMLEITWEALEDAGQMTEKLEGSFTGVFIGAQSHSSDYYSMQLHRGQLDTYSATGTAHSILANRLSFLLNLTGPSMTIDTACSSSLVAVHLACQSLRAKECDLAVAGGINLILTADFQICLEKLEMMAPDGRCKTFDRRANGFVRGEGCGVVILKPLPQALADGDPVLAVILGSAVNQDGSSNGLTAPNGKAQQALLERALAAAQISPEAVTYVETHGTGTALGDPIEVEALKNVLSAGPSKASCILGAVKTNIGHLEAASGIAGLIKTVLSLEHGAVPRNLHLKEVNPHLPIAGSRFVLPVENQSWPKAELPRVAGVSSFGFGGTNAHVILSDSARTGIGTIEAHPQNRTALLLPISARTSSGLRALANEYIRFLTTGEGSQLSPADIAYTASLRRNHHDYRWCVVGNGPEDWAFELRRRLNDAKDQKIHSAPTIVFFYGSDCGHRAKLCKRLQDAEPVFAKAFERAKSMLRGEIAKADVHSSSFGAVNLSPESLDSSYADTFLLQVGLTELWRSWGIQPTAVVGHGFGEIGAAYASGMLNLDDATRVVCCHLRLANSRSEDHLRESTSASLRGLAIAKPYISVISTVSGDTSQREDIAFDAWMPKSTNAALSDSAVHNILSIKPDLIVEIGLCSDLGDSLNRSTTDNQNPVVMNFSSIEGEDEYLATLRSLSRMYEMGSSVNWRHCFPVNERCVKLPRYPWQRQRYWLEPEPTERSVPPASQKSSKESGRPSSWFYEIHWEPGVKAKAVIPGTDTVDLLVADDIVSGIKRSLPEIERENRVESQAGLRERLDELTIGYIGQALSQLGMDVSSGGRWHMNQLKNIVSASYQRLVDRLQNILVSADLVSYDGIHCTVKSALSSKADPSTTRELISRFPEAEQILRLHERCGSRLSEVLRGICDPLALLFGQDERYSAERIYRDALPSKVSNQALAHAIKKWVAQMPRHRRLRILELGAGTGSATSAVLPCLPATRCEYVFSDISPFFLKRAAEKFADYRFVQYEMLDVEQSSSERALGEQFDLIIATNVIHATRDLAISLENIKKLLRPLSSLFMVECTTPRPWMDITFGLTHGWWRFSDSSRRHAHPLLMEEEWIALLGELGFTDVFATSLQEPGTAVFDQSFFCARNSPRFSARNSEERAARSDEASKYLIFGISSALTEELKRQIEAAGDRCYMVPMREANDIAGDFKPAESIDFEWACHEIAPACQAIFYVDTTETQSLKKTFELPLRIIQKLSKNGVSAPQGFWLVTRGAQPLQVFETDPRQALIWGLGRAATLEAPLLRTRLIDLDPAEKTERAVSSLLAEVEDISPEDQIVVRGGQRYLPRLQQAPQIPKQTSPFKISGTHLITGGLGSIGSELALRLATCGAEQLILVVKHALPERRYWDALSSDDPDWVRVALVRRLESFGCHIVIEALDLEDKHVLPQLLTNPDLKEWPLRGVWHTAMNLSKSPMMDLSCAAANAMIAVKCEAAWQLHELTQTQTLDAFVLFSSTTALWGATGLAHYAAANAFLDSLAHYRRGKGLPATVINWGMWAKLDQASNAEQLQAERVGLHAMAPSAALSALEEVLKSGICQSVVADIDWTIFKPAYESRRVRPFLSKIRIDRENRDAHPTVEPFRIELLRTAKPQERHAILAQHIQKLLVKILGFGSETPIDRTKGFFELGMDSLTSMQMRRLLEQDLGCALPSTVIFNYPTILELTDYLVEHTSPNHRGGIEFVKSFSDEALEERSRGEGNSSASEEELFEELAKRISALRS